MSAKDTANMAAAAKRSATAIQRLAQCLDDLSVKEKNALAEAAQILMKHGKRTKNKALSEKRDELIRERAQAKARAEARQIIAAWPQTAALDRIAIIYSTQYGADRLRSSENGRDPRWELDYATREAIEEIVADAVYRAVPYSVSTAAVPVAGYMAQRRDLVDQMRGRAGVVALAAKWDAAQGAAEGS